MKGRDRRAGPDQHPDVDVLGHFRQQRPQDNRGITPDELEVRRDVPPADVTVSRASWMA